MQSPLKTKAKVDTETSVRNTHTSMSSGARREETQQ
jgi:hypothetical protein